MKVWAWIRSRLIDPVVRAQGSPKSLARGAALGTWLTLTPTVGIQMTIAAFVGIPWGANMPIAIAIVWLSNPLTIVPLYYSYYWLGTLLMPVPTRSYAELGAEFAARVDAIANHGEGLLTSLGKLGSEVLWPMVVGSLLLATALAIPAYFVTLRLATARQARRLREQAAAQAVQAASAAPVPPRPHGGRVMPGVSEATPQ